MSHSASLHVLFRPVLFINLDCTYILSLSISPFEGLAILYGDCLVIRCLPAGLLICLPRYIGRSPFARLDLR